MHSFVQSRAFPIRAYRVRSTVKQRRSKHLPKHPLAASNRPPRGGSEEKHEQKPSPAQPRDRYLPGGIRIVHEDHDIIVIDKPAGILTADVEGGREGRDTDSVFAKLKRHVREQRKRRGTRLWIIHRLDKEASGLLVFAKTEDAYGSLKEQFRVKTVHRLYAAVVEGEIPGAGSDINDSTTKSNKPGLRLAPQPPGGTITGHLAEGQDGIVRVVDDPIATTARSRERDGEPKLAVTHWRLQQGGIGRSLLQVRLETGRKNQIRVHMQSIGRPIVGDRRYGAQTDPIGRVCLHAFELGFTHPTTGATSRFRSPTPPEFFSLVRGRRARTEAILDESFTPRAPGANADAAAQSSRHSDTAPRPSGDSLASWDHVAPWYESLIEGRGSDHHENVILPGTLRLIGAKPGERVLDVACGEGNLCRELARAGVIAVGVDASPRLIEAARRSTAGPLDAAAPKFHVADARQLDTLDLGTFDHAACIMALMNIDPLEPLVHGIASRLNPGGRFVAVILHPAFRSPGRTSWAWEARDRGVDEDNSRPAQRKPHKGRESREVRQFRRVDAYLSETSRQIVMNPGAASSGALPVTTITHHRPISTYVRFLSSCGFVIDAIEEWPSARISEPGPRAEEENRARREIPMFLAIRARLEPAGERVKRQA